MANRRGNVYGLIQPFAGQVETRSVLKPQAASSKMEAARWTLRYCTGGQAMGAKTITSRKAQSEIVDVLDIQAKQLNSNRH
jgi:hypothetical protein